MKTFDALNLNDRDERQRLYSKLIELQGELESKKNKNRQAGGRLEMYARSYRSLRLTSAA